LSDSCKYDISHENTFSGVIARAQPAAISL
jgi:hypothetical protein